MCSNSKSIRRSDTVFTALVIPMGLVFIVFVDLDTVSERAEGDQEEGKLCTLLHLRRACSTVYCTCLLVAR